MQWTALRAHLPVVHRNQRRSSCALADTTGRLCAGRLAASGFRSAGSSSENQLLKPQLLHSAGCCPIWISSSGRRSLRCCPPLRAVNPRSRREWLLLHNLPLDSLDEKAVIGKERKQDVHDDAVSVDSLESKFELVEKKGNGSDHRTERFPKERSNYSDVPIQTGDFQNGKFRDYSSGDTIEGLRRRVSLAKQPSGREEWMNRTHQAQRLNTLHGKDENPETDQYGGSRQRKETSFVSAIQTGTRLGSSPESAALRKTWTKDGFSSGVAPQRRQTAKTSAKSDVRRDLRKNGTLVEERYHQPQNTVHLQTSSLQESKQGGESDAGTPNQKGLRADTFRGAPQGLQPLGRVSLLEGSNDTREVVEGSSEEGEIPELVSGNRELVDHNGEKVMEVWRKGRVVKRYKPLGMEYLYGRTKPTRLYGPLNSRGEVPGSDLAPVPRKYRDRCEHGKGWNIREVVAKVLELNHWDDVDFILNQWVGRFNRMNFHALVLAMTRTGALKHSVRLFTWMKNQRCYRARTDIYNLMIWLYARHYRIDSARALFKEMQEWRCKPDVETYNALINVHGRARQWRESLFYYDRMLRAAVPPSTGTYNNLISACGNCGQWEKALALFEKMKSDGVYVDVVTHNAVLTALKIGKQYAKAIAHFDKTLEWKVLPDTVTLNIIISCFSKMEKYDEAVQLFNSMTSSEWEGCRPDLVTFSTVMHVYAVSGQVENVRAVFDLMSKAGVVPNIVCYNTVVGAYASLGMDAEALKVFETMQKVGFEPDVVSYTALMNAYSKAGKPDDAARLLETMRNRSRKPNVVTYNTLIEAYGAAGQVAKAVALLPDMDYDDASPNVVTICSLVVACGRSSEIGKISGILEVAALRKIGLNVNVYNTVLSVYLNHGMVDEAEKVFARMKEENVAPDSVTFAVLINGAAQGGDVYQAQLYFDEMLGAGIGFQVEACSALIHAYAEQVLPEAAHAMLTRMREAGCEPNVLTYTSLIHAYTLAEMPGAAITVYEEMDALGVELDVVACSALFTVFNNCGQPEKTLLMWSKWREYFQFGPPAYTQLSKACSMLTDRTAALDLFDSMQQSGVPLTPKIGSNLLRSLTKDGKIDQRSNILGRFEADGVQLDSRTYKMVLKCLEKVDLWDNYIEVYDQMMTSGCSVDLDVSRVMLDVLRGRGQEERARELESTIRHPRLESERNLKETASV